MDKTTIYNLSSKGFERREAFKVKAKTGRAGMVLAIYRSSG